MKNFNKSKIIAFLLMMSIAVSAFGGCAQKLPDETVPSIQTTESTTEETTETTPEETEPSLGPNSTAVVTERIVDVYGQLSVDGINLVNEQGEPVQLKGMSSYGLQACGNFFTEDNVQTLAEDWGCDVLRIAMYTDSGSDGYVKDPEKYFNKVCEITDRCIAQGIYVIIDWHVLQDCDPNKYKELSLDFFSRISAIYKDSPNVIYEICNEPNGMRIDVPDAEVDWENCIRPYAVDVISAIRANDPDNIIIVGTPNWSQRVDMAAEHPIEGDNIMYTVHFYAGSHGQELRDNINTANEKGLAVFVTEWGTTNDSGKGQVYFDESRVWMDFLDEKGISWCNWSIGGSNTQTSNALLFSSEVLTVEQKYAGHWPDDFISNSGLYVRSLILEDAE